MEDTTSLHRDFSALWQLIRSVEESDDPELWGRYVVEIREQLTAFFPRNPHWAMEALEYAAEVFPKELAGPLVRHVVCKWKGSEGYSWQAGGGADHCYLSALLLTSNGDLAEPELVRKCIGYLPSKGMRDRTRDAREKEANLLKATADYSA